MLRRDPLANADALIRQVYKFVSYRLGDGPLAEDVTSEVFERAVRYRASYDARRGEPIAWLIGIASRCVAAAPPQVEAHRAVDEEAAGDLEAETIERLSLDSALSRLSERDQELLSLRYGADLTARQIGGFVGMEKNAVEVALHRALERLRQQLEAGERGLAAAGNPL